MEEPIQAAQVLGSRHRRRLTAKQKALDQSTAAEAGDGQSDSAAVAGPSQRTSQNHTESLIQPIPVAYADIDLAEQPIASSSKLTYPLAQIGTKASSSKKRPRESRLEFADEKHHASRRFKKKSKKEKRKPTAEGAEKAVEREGKGKEKAVADDVEPEIPTWDCVPLASKEVLRLPPVWSRDGQ